MYFRKRIPRNVTLTYNGLATAPICASINSALFEWVIENLLKNALDALQGHGAIDVFIGENDTSVYVEVRDTGKGIPKSNWKRIFVPGFTTKTRGWGLGLALATHRRGLPLGTHRRRALGTGQGHDHTRNTQTLAGQ